MASITIENMLGYNQTWDLEINSTAEYIENTLNITYKQLVSYFTDKKISDNEKINAAENIIDKISVGYSIDESRGDELKNGYYNLTSENIFSIIEGNTNEGEEVRLIKKLTEYIILFSIFDYKDETCFDPYNSSKATINENDKESVYIHGDIAGIQDGYHFFNGSRFFKLLDNIFGSSWEELTVTYKNNNKTETNLRQALLNGYIKKGDNVYILFKNENEILDFMYDFLNSEFTTIDFSEEGRNYFRIYREGMLPSYLLANKIKETFFTLIDIEEQISRESKVVKVQLGDLNNKAEIVFSANNNDTIYKYIDLYSYSIELFKNYVSELKSIPNYKIEDDKYVNQLFDKIIGGSYKQLTSNYRADKIDDYLFSIILNNITNISVNQENMGLTAPSRDLRNADNSTFYSSIFLSDIKPDAINKIISKKEVFNIPLNFFEVLYDSNDINSNSLLLRKISYNSVSATDVDIYRNNIDNLSKMSGNIISKLSFFIFNEFKGNTENPSEEHFDENKWLKITLPNYKLFEKNRFETSATIVTKVNGVECSTYEEVYAALAKPIRAMLRSICEQTNQSEQAADEIKAQLEHNRKFSEYIKSRFADGYFTEEDFFYIDDGTRRKKAPVNTFVDVEFRVPEFVDNKWKSTWLPVTAVRDYNEKRGYGIDVDTGDKFSNIGKVVLHAGTYFNNFELEDKGGTKEITLTLKSVNDINLENIIFYSLAIDRKKSVGISDGEKTVKKEDNPMSYLEQIIKDSDFNFRVRFGYRDRVKNKESGEGATITSSNEFEKEFINRDKKAFSKDKDGKAFVKPVQVYPWTYFKITGIQSNIRDGEDTYTITGVSSGSYMLKNLSLCGVQPNFSGKTDGTNDTYKGTPKNVIGKLARWITQASCINSNNMASAKIVFLSDDGKTIITGYDPSKRKFDHKYSYKLRNYGEKDGYHFRGGNLESVENFFFNSTNTDILNSKTFNMVSDSKTYSIKDILDNLCQWLPDRVYYIAKDGDSGRTVAVYIPYEDIYKIEGFFNNYPYKTEKMTYQVIEADAYLYNADTTIDNNKIINENDYQKVFFIRMYYEGPGISSDDEENEQSYLRVYNYRSVQNQVIESIDISDNNAELGNLISSVTLLGAGTPIVFTYDRESGKLNSTISSQTSGMKFDEKSLRQKVSSGVEISDLGTYESYFRPNNEEDVKPYLALNNSKYVLLEDFGFDELPVSVSNKQEVASNFFTSQQNKEFTGEITIMGDPFYYFDSTVEAGKYEIYLQMNRVMSRDSYELIESKYTGIYYITGIKHSIDESGKYTTVLSVAKRIFGTGDTENNKK